MAGKIVVLGWGSLIWQPKNLKVIDNKWYPNGPDLPLEFERISNDGRLTLVISVGKKNLTSLYAISEYTEIDEAIQNLRLREGTSSNNIGFYNFLNNEFHVKKSNVEIIEGIVSWNKLKNFDGVIWTDLDPNFEQIRSEKFNLISAIDYLKTVNHDTLKAAKTYIENAPKQIQTECRGEISDFLNENFL